ncbi:MAG: VCBS repeat-containing protein, partial [Actinobacteria bacterium]|nr:VCBS repeat-containing protein [Actinomycetota bacterium]
MLHRNDGAAFTDVSSQLPPSSSFGDGHFGDVDGDGDPDVVLSAHQRTALWRNDGSGVMTDVTLSHVPPGRGTAPFALADWDGDGDLDAGSDRMLLLNTGNGTLIDASANFPASIYAIQPFAAADVESDGDLD